MILAVILISILRVLEQAMAMEVLGMGMEQALGMGMERVLGMDMEQVLDYTIHYTQDIDTTSLVLLERY